MVRFVVCLVLVLLLLPAAASAADRDRDGMADAWERRHHVFGPRADPDRDGLTNRFEFRRRTNPRRADSDRDGLGDADELRFRWNPRRADTDKDGVRDGDEGAGRVEDPSDQGMTVRLPDGRALTARFGEDTEMICPATDYDADGLDDPESDEGYDQSEPSDDEPKPGDIFGTGETSEEESTEPFVDRCVDYFKPGTLIHEASVRDGVFVHVALVE